MAPQLNGPVHIRAAWDLLLALAMSSLNDVQQQHEFHQLLEALIEKAARDALFYPRDETAMPFTLWHALRLIGEHLKSYMWEENPLNKDDLLVLLKHKVVEAMHMIEKKEIEGL